MKSALVNKYKSLSYVFLTIICEFTTICKLKALVMPAKFKILAVLITLKFFRFA